MHRDGAPGEGVVKFAVEDATGASRALARLGIRRDRVECCGGRQWMTARYRDRTEAQRLFAYLVRRVDGPERDAWQQDQAHREVEGWCDLCEAASGGECAYWCLRELAVAR
jgi:hypothetical protein